MTNPLRQQIEDMEPRRYARAAKRAAEAAESSALKEGIQVSVRIRHLLDSTEDELAEEQRLRLFARSERASPSRPSVGGGLASSVDLVADVEVKTPDSLNWLSSLIPAPEFTTEARSATRTFPVPWLSGSSSPAATFETRKLAPAIGASLLSAWLRGGLMREGSGPTEAAVGHPTGRHLPLKRGEGMMSADGSWQVSWRQGGELLVIVRGDEPWSTDVADDDLVTVDPATRTIVIEGPSPRSQSVWQRNPLRVEHSSIKHRATNHIRAIRISNNDRSAAPTVIALPTWERLAEGDVPIDRRVDNEGAYIALLDADAI